MNILDETEIEFIESQSKHYLPDRQKYENSRVFLSTLRIINIVLGKEWYEKSSTGFVDKKGLRKLDETKSHPISKLLGSGEPTQISKLVQFANYMQILYDGEDFIEKIRKYVRDEKRSEITFEKFESVSFELRVACYHKLNNLKIEFLRESGIPSPDLKIISNQDYVFLECKKKKPRNDFSLTSILGTIRDANDEQIVPRGKSGIIAINLSLKEHIYRFYQRKILDSIQTLIKKTPLINFVEVYNDYVHTKGPHAILGTNKQVIENPHPQNELSKNIIEVVMYPQRIPNMLPFKINAPI